MFGLERGDNASCIAEVCVAQEGRVGKLAIVRDCEVACITDYLELPFPIQLLEKVHVYFLCRILGLLLVESARRKE